MNSSWHILIESTHSKLNSCRHAGRPPLLVGVPWKKGDKKNSSKAYLLFSVDLLPGLGRAGTLKP